MRPLLFLLFVFTIHFSAGQSLLEEKISVSFKNFTVEKCLRMIEEASTAEFSYNSKQIAGLETRINADFDAAEISTVLDRVFKGTSFSYKEIGKQITLFEVKSAEGSVVISGYIRERFSKEEIIGARVYFPAHGVACITNTYGYYAIEIPKGASTLFVASVGMMKIREDIQADEDMVIHFDLEEDTVFLSTVQVFADSIRQPKIVSNLPYLDKTDITNQALSRIPPVNGEIDVMKYLQQLPGVTASTEGGATFQVRGSGSGSNLILLDEIPIYHPTHLLGLYSIINPDALKSATLYKDFIPVSFGSRNASVLQIHTKEGNLNRHELSGSLGFVSTRLNWQGPIVKNRASFYLSGRRSAFPAIAGQFLQNQQLSLPRFFDVNGKVNIHLNSNNRLYFTAYMGEDNLSDSISTYNWGNTAGAIRWNHIFNSKTFSNTSVTHSEFDYGYILSTGYALDNFRQRVVTDKASFDVTNYFRGNLKFTYGLSVTWLRTRFGNGSIQSSTLFLQRNAFENALYFSAEKKLSRKLKIEAGVRLPFSFHIGSQDTTDFLQPDLSTINVIFEKNKFYDPQFFVDPRALLTFALGEKNQLQAATGIVSQNTHIINYVHYFLPVELWTTSNKYLKPERNFQTSFGWVHSGNRFHISLTGFNKFVWNVPDYAVPVFTPSSEIESNLLTGIISATGLECMVNFIVGSKYSVSGSYTFTNSVQRVRGINSDKVYPTTNSRPHNIAISQFINLSRKWTLSTNFTWHTGKAVTLPNGQFVIGGTAFPVYDNTRNAERLPFFSRWDLSVVRKFGWKKKREMLNLLMSITNVTGRFNPALVYIKTATYDPSLLQTVARDYTPFMIYLSLNFKL